MFTISISNCLKCQRFGLQYNRLRCVAALLYDATRDVIAVPYIPIHRYARYMHCNCITNSNFITRLSPAFLIEFQNVYAKLADRINTPKFHTQYGCTSRYEAVLKFNLHIEGVSVALNELIVKSDYSKNAE